MTKKAFYILGGILLGVLLVVMVARLFFNNNNSSSSMPTNLDVANSNETMALGNDTHDFNLKGASFLVLYSNMLEEGVELVSYSSSGAILSQLSLNVGKKLDFAAKVKGNIYIASERQHHHFQISQDGKIRSFFGPSIYEQDRAIGATFIRNSNGYLLFSMNMGAHPDYSPHEYGNELVYWNDDDHVYNHLKLTGYFMSAVTIHNKAYVLYSNGKRNSNGIYVVDLKTNKLVSDYPLRSIDRYYPVGRENGSSLQLYNNRLLVFMTGDDPSQKQDQPVMLVINPQNGTIEQTIKVSNKSFDLYGTFVHNGKVYVVSYEGELVVFNQKFEIETLIRLEQGSQFVMKRKEESGLISGVQVDGDSLFILYDFVKNAPLDRQKEIHQYHIDTGKELAVIPLSHKTDREMVRFFITK
ncbi:hypothetical protein [Paenibacillus taiwanensis]|uniref:hypothetical protein n=1 Tax=Paenibacillus taiwanensis TaxID=401638 RepID=UPI0012F9A117|nr:hypothetical protein [Paenibacillus taiwanensis]